MLMNDVVNFSETNQDLVFSLNEMIKQARSAYFRQLISSNKNNPKTFFEIINNIVSPQMSQIQVYSASDWNKILMYFVNKVQDVRANICLSDDIQILLKKIKPSACPLDFIPTSLFLKVFDQIGPHLVKIINLSLQTGSVPVSISNRWL